MYLAIEKERRNSKKGIIYVIITFIILLQLAFFYSEITGRLSHLRYSLFWDDEELEEERAKQREIFSKAFVKDLKNVNNLSSDHLIEKRAQADKNRKNFWEIFHSKNLSTKLSDYKDSDKIASAPIKRSKLCIGIVSVDRRPHSYLTQTMTSVLQGLDEEISDQVNFFILNTMKEREQHPEAEELSSIIPVVHSEDAPNLYPKPNRKRRGYTWNQKETLDYAFALRICEKIGRYTLILEDDLVLSSHFFQKLIYRALDPLEDAEEKSTFGKESESETKTLGKPWLFVRLFYSEYWSGWSKDDIPLFLLLSSGIAAVGTLFVIRIISLIELRSFIPFLKGKPILVLVTFAFLAALSGFSLFAIGKQNIFTPFANGLYPFDPAATAVGVVYPSFRTKSLGDYMIQHYMEAPNDILMDKYAIDNQLQRLLLVPNLVQHIGVYSSNRYKNQGNFKDMKVSSTFEP